MAVWEFGLPILYPPWQVFSVHSGFLLHLNIGILPYLLIVHQSTPIHSRSQSTVHSIARMGNPINGRTVSKLNWIELSWVESSWVELCWVYTPPHPIRFVISIFMTTMTTFITIFFSTAWSLLKRFLHEDLQPHIRCKSHLGCSYSGDNNWNSYDWPRYLVNFHRSGFLLCWIANNWRCFGKTTFLTVT